MKRQKGITLIALIITIVVLLILAVVAIGAVRDSGIIGHAQNAEKDYTEEQEKEKISVALSEWAIQKYTQGETRTFAEYMQGRIEGATVTDNGDGTITVAFKNNAYKVTADGTITSTKGISISNSKLTLEYVEGETVTSELTASLIGIEEEITWSNSNNSIATISSATGSTITVTAVSKGETIVTATCGKYSATCTVIVADPIEVGTYVEYDIEYIDMYSGNTYNKDNGWRYLGKDDNGNYLIVSTAIPGILYYHYNPDTKPEWWGEDADVTRVYGEEYSANGWDDDAGYPNRYAAYGLRYKFESIPFTYQESGTSVSTKNTGIFRKVGNTTSGTSINLDFKVEGVNVVDVHNLTLAELNRATNSASGSTRSDTTTSSGFKDIGGNAKGLFDMQDLDNYTANYYYYWLASPNSSYASNLCHVYYDLSNVNSSGNSYYGVRPVVTLSSSIKLEDTNNDRILEIK